MEQAKASSAVFALQDIGCFALFPHTKMATTFLPVLLTAAFFCLHVLPNAATPLPFSADNDDPAHEIYGWGPMYPNTTLGGLIVEGAFPYKNGPVIWNDTLTSGAYGARH